MLATELFLRLTIFLGGPSTLLFWQMTSLHLGMQWALEKISWLLFVELYLQNLRNSANHSLCVYSMYIQCSTLNMIPLLDVKIELQKITDKQFISSVFIHTKVSRKWTKFSQKWGRKYIKICENFERKLTNFVSSFSRV